MVWNHKTQTPAITVNHASTELFQWQQAQSKVQKQVSFNIREGVAVWKKPNPGWLTCNVDAAVNIRGNSSSFGCLIRDDTWTFKAAYGGSFVGISDAKMAEAMAFREALSWLKKMQIQRVYIELDALGVVQAFRSNQNDDSYFGSVISECVSIVKDLRSPL